VKEQSERHIIIRHPAKEPVLWIVDSEQWPRACLRAELIERGYNPYGFIGINDALESFSQEEAQKPEVLVLELRGQNLTGAVLESIGRLKIPTILLAGNPEINDPLIANYHWDVILRRPVTLGTVADIVERIVPMKRP